MARKGEKPKAKTNRPGKPKKGGGGFESQLKRRTTKASRDRLIQKFAGQRTTLESRNQFLDKHKIRDPDLDDPGYFTRPQTLGQTQIEADRATSLRYGGEESQLGQQAQQIPAWFQQYQNQISQAQQQTAAMAQPAIAQAQQTAATAGQPVLGSAAPAGSQENDALAAASRKALGDAFASMMQTNQQSTSNYFAGRQGVAGAAQIGALTDNARARTQLEADKGNFRSGQIAQARDKERQYGLERSAFGLDAAKEEADQAESQQKAASDRAKDRRDRQADRRKQREDTRRFGITRADKLAADRARQRDKDEDQAIARERARNGGGSGGNGGRGGLTPVQRRAAKRESQKAIERITTARGLWGDYSKQTVEVGGKKRKPTPSEIKARMRSEGYSSSEIHLMLVHRAGKRWSPQDRKTARRLGITIRDL